MVVSYNTSPAGGRPRPCQGRRDLDAAYNTGPGIMSMYALLSMPVHPAHARDPSEYKRTDYEVQLSD